jgi:ribosomal protein S12 methylthiotransferase accessory factor
LSHRTLPVGETLMRLRDCAKRVPITRVSDLTPLDRLRLPVFSATTPLARDLTTHLGKGLDAQSAQVSAMMEAVERISAEQVGRPTLRLPFSRMKRRSAMAVDPREFDLPDECRYAEGRPISWIDGWDLVNDEEVWVPLDVAITPPRDGVLVDVDTNGLAAGNTLLEAVVHGVCEVIERDAMSILLFRSMFGDADDLPDMRRIAPESLPDEGRAWLRQIANNNLTITTALLESDIGVPVFRSVLIDYGYPSRSGDPVRRFVGFGAGPSATAAALRSITEAVQSRVAIVQGARDSFNTVSPPWRRSAARWHRRDHESGPQISLATVPSFVSNDLRDDLAFLVGRLHDAGFRRVIAVDLSRPDFGFSVVRIRVPGLAAFAVNRTRPGWRCLRYLL